MPSLDWDFIAYHLPFALKRFHMTTFEVSDKLQLFYVGFPPLAQYIQGLIAFIFQDPFKAPLASFVFLTFFLMTLKFCFDWFSILLFLGLFVTVPLNILHLRSGYIDIYLALSLAACFFTLFGTYLGIDSRKSFKVKMLFVAWTLITMLLKYQGWPFVAIFCALFAWLELKSSNSTMRIPDKKDAALYLILILVVGYWPLRNLLINGSIVYPLKTSFLFYPHHDLTYLDPAEYTSFPDALSHYSRFERYLYSVFEIGRFTSNEYYLYSIDQFRPAGNISINNRMGGWNLVTISTILTVSILTFVKCKKTRLPYFVFLFLFLLTGLMPQSHEMRYWLFIPMIGICLFQYSVAKKLISGFVILIFIVVIPFNLFHLWSRLKIQSYESFEPLDYFPPSSLEYIKKRRTNAVNREPVECVPTTQHPTLFWSGKNFSEFKVKDC
ncbi:MAG: hypothetical protein EOP48_10070 [Sphingobacteriales bacterium]|nr:MAG: hypothetical protein EOP48_10070 [Sphingobacteriales bacterium]